MRVFILATCRKPELLPMATLVFKTLRVGFPTAEVSVAINPTTQAHANEIRSRAEEVGCEAHDTDTVHHQWLFELLSVENEPFFILDTDIIAYDNVEGFACDAPLSGWRIPEWVDDFSGSVTRARLHTSLLYIDPIKARKAIVEYERPIPESPFTPKANLVYPLVVPFKGKRFFYDTCSLLYHAIGGQPFTDAQKDKYFHYNFGTISDLVLPRLNTEDAKRIGVAMQEVIDRPATGRGRWREQEQFYANHQLR